MSQITDQADELRKRAIEILLTERAAIDEHLAMLAYDAMPAEPPARGRVCGFCGIAGHNARRCPKNNTDAPSPDASRS